MAQTKLQAVNLRMEYYQPRTGGRERLVRGRVAGPGPSPAGHRRACQARRLTTTRPSPLIRSAMRKAMSPVRSVRTMAAP